MDHYIRWPKYKELKKQHSRENLVERLQGARDKLSPILDDVIMSASKLMKRGCFQDWMLTPQQYQDIIWAWHILEECETRTDDRNYKLANVDFIVNNVSVNGRMMSVKDKSIIIDEASVLELLELYQNMGVIIQRLLTDGVRIDNKTDAKSISSIRPSEGSVRRSRTSSKYITAVDLPEEKEPSYDEFEEHMRRKSSKHVSTPPSSTSFADIHDLHSGSSHRSRTSTISRRKMTKSEEFNSQKGSDEDLIPPEIKSTLSAIITSSSGELQKEKSEHVTASSEHVLASSERGTVSSEHVIASSEHGTASSDHVPASSDDDSYQKRKSKSYDNEPSLFIRIRCFSDNSDVENESRDKNGRVIECAKDCPSHYHIRLDGEPITLKMNQNNVDDGTVYCINTDDGADNEIKIIIKQCPDCKSTVIGSSTKLKDMMGESHESITLHGKQGDESNMAFSSDESEYLKDSEKCKCLQKGRVCTNISKVRCEEFSSPCSCDELSRFISEHKVVSEHEVLSEHDSEPEVVSDNEVFSDHEMISDHTVVSDHEVISDHKVVSDHKVISDHEVVSDASDTKLDVLIDAESVDRSTVKVHESREPSVQNVESNIIKAKSSILLTRRRICSSMEFDVTTVHTKLREHEIQHGNSHIVVELKKLGVDQILRACRPAKCCRKAILDEKQRTALPYCVSLKSLPLMGNDIEVIKQSIDMSVNKIRNSMDLTKTHKDKLAYYVNLGRDYFKPNLDYPWVIPVYDVELSKSEVRQDKFFVLRNSVSIPKQPKSFTKIEKGSVTKLIERKSVTKLTSVDRSEQKRTSKLKCLAENKYFRLKKLISNNSVKFEKLKLRKHDYATQRRVRFKSQNNLSDYSDNSRRNCFVRMLKSRQTRSIYKSKNIWNNICHDDWPFILAQDNKKLGLSNVDFTFGQNKISKRHDCSKSSSKVSVHYEKMSHLTKFVSPQSTIEHTCNLLTKVPSTPKPLEGGDCSLSSLSDMFDIYMNDKKQISTILSKFEVNGKKLDSPKSTPNFWKELSEKLYYTSNALTVLVHRTQSLAKCQDIVKEPQVPPLEQPDKYSPLEALETKKNTNQIKLEYYVALVNGDLVWSNRLPLESQNFATFYTHSNQTDQDSTPPTNPVDDPMYATQVTPEERNRPVHSRAQRNSQDNLSSQDRRSTISELPLEQMAHLQNNAEPSEAPLAAPLPRQKPPAAFESYPLGPETEEASWVPHLVSDTSLPIIHEEIMKQEVKAVEAAPQAAPQAPSEPAKSKCSTKAVCVRNKCNECKSKASGTNRRCFPGDIKINIQKTKDKGIRVVGKGPTPCNKEICEIYKNKNLVPDKAGACPGSKSKDGCQQFKISAKDNIEIYINNQKVCLGKGKSKKKERQENKKEARPEKKKET